MSLTKRDEALLRALRRFRVARTSDLIRFAFPRTRRDTTATRLRRLFDAGYLAVRSDGQAEENLYHVGPQGRQWLRALGMNPGIVPRGGLDHHLAIVRTWIDLAVGVHDVEGLRLVSVWPDWELRKNPRARRLVPDLLATVQEEREEPTRGFALAIEVDCGTEPLWVLKRKFQGYELHGLDGKGLGQELGIGVVLTRASAKRREGIEVLLQRVWSGWYQVWTMTEGPKQAIRKLQNWMEGPLTRSPYGKGREGRVSRADLISSDVRGGGL